MAVTFRLLPRYLHWQPLLAALSCWALSASLLAMTSSEWVPLVVAPASLAGLLGAVGMARAYQSRYAPDFKAWLAAERPPAPVFALEQEQLRLLRPYPFAASLIANRTTIAVAELTEVSTAGNYVVFAGREKLFFTREQYPAVLAFAERHDLPRRSRPPRWTWLSARLDATEEAPANRHDQDLLTTGLSAAEIQYARRELRRGWWLTFRWLEASHDSWGWPVYVYHHEAILYLTGCSWRTRRSWYWYTMEIALREVAA
jgi:hypothetical protein